MVHSAREYSDPVQLTLMQRDGHGRSTSSSLNVVLGIEAAPLIQKKEKKKKNSKPAVLMGLLGCTGEFT